MQDLIDPLAALRDIHLPAEPPWWPPAAGWWWLMLALVLFAGLILLLLRFLYQRRYRLRYQSLQTLKQLRKRVDQGGDESLQPICAELSQLLKSVAVRQFPDRPVAGLTGKAWLEFLNRSDDSNNFTRGCGHSLISAPYQPAPQIDLKALLDLSEHWLLHNT